MAVAASAANTSAPPVRGPLHHLGQLFWLKWTLTKRGFQRSKSTLFGTIIALIVLLPFALSLGGGLGFAFFRANHFYGELLLRGSLLGIYFIWLIAPVLGFSLNDSYDITRLFVYPVSMRRLFAGSILGSLLDLMTLLLLPTLCAVLIGWGHQSIFAAFVSLLTVSLFLFHTLALSQAVVLASAGVLRSRKFRDVAIVIVPLFWILYQVGARTFLRPLFASVRSTDWQKFAQSPTWETVNLLPPGLAARALANGAANQYLPALGFLALLALVTAGTVYLAGWLVKKAYEGEEVSLIAPKVQKAGVVVPAGTSTGVAAVPVAPARDFAPGGLRLPPVVAAIVDKELKYFTRDPYFRLVLMNSVYLLVMGLFFSLNSVGKNNGFVGLSGAGIWWGTSLLLFQQTTLVFNQFGTESGSAQTFFAFPASRRQMIIGKNLPLFGAFSLMSTVMTVALCVLLHQLPLLVVLLPWMLLALGVMMSVGNLMSVYFPSKIVVKGFRTRQSASAGQGIAFTFIYLGVTLASLFMYAPVLAGLLLPYYFFGAVWLLLTIPVCLIYVVGLYFLSLKLAEPLLIARETLIIEKVYRAAE